MLELRDQPVEPAPQQENGGNGEVAPDADAPGLNVEARQQLLSGPTVEAEPLELDSADGTQALAPLAALRPVAVDRRLLAPGEREPLWKRWLYVAVALVLAWLHFDFTRSFWAPAHWGNNQNGYLVGAKNLATTLKTTGFEPSSPFEFVGWMWVMGDGASTAPGGGMHYPKYPIGVPLVDAVVYRAGLALFNETTAIEWVYRISPIAMALALLGTFFLTRELANSFAGVLAMILLGTLPLVLILSNNPNSHALSLCFICWGMFALVRWWETLSWWRGLLAGFLLGYAVTIRYTEGLLVLPMMIAGLMVVTYRPSWLVSWWRIGVWVIFATAAVLLNDSLGRDTFAWQQWLTTNLGAEMLWWHRAFLVALPILITLRWTNLRSAFTRDSLFAGEWMRMLACAGIVLVAAIVKIPHLESGTPFVLHCLRLLAILVFFGMHIVLMHLIRWSEPRTWLPAATLAIGWLVPVVFLIAFNKLTVGTWTGYDTTNESVGFTWNHFSAKWLDTLNQLYNQGLYFILPLGLIGMLLAFRWNWRAALLLLLWFIPGTLLYMAYYYGRGMPLIGYLRFFTSMLPAAVIAAVWLIYRASLEMQASAPATAGGDELNEPGGIRRWLRDSWRRGSFAVPVAAGAFVALPASVNLNGMLGPLERDGVVAVNLADVGHRARAAIPDDAIIFGHSQHLLNHLQFAGKSGWRYYGADYFGNSFPVPRMRERDPDQPTPIQPARRQFLRQAFENLSNREKARLQNQIMTAAIDEGKRVFVILETSQMAAFRRAFLPASRFEIKSVQRWRDGARQSELGLRALASLGADIAGRGAPARWEILEVILKPDAPTPAPSTAPTTPEAKKSVVMPGPALDWKSQSRHPKSESRVSMSGRNNIKDPKLVISDFRAFRHSGFSIVSSFDTRIHHAWLRPSPFTT